MGGNRIKPRKKEAVKSLEQQLRASEWLPVALCLFVIVCYGIYLLQGFISGLSFSSKYSTYIFKAQAFAQLSLFGNLGLVAFTIVELGILLDHTRSGIIARKQFFYIVALVGVSNLLAYAFVSYLFGYANILIR